jgi:hypothetical protein
VTQFFLITILSCFVLLMFILNDLRRSSYCQIEHWIPEDRGAISRILLLLIRIAWRIAVKLYQSIVVGLSSWLRSLIFVAREVHRLKQCWLWIVILMKGICCAAEDWSCGVWNEINSLLKELISWEALSIRVSYCCSSSLLLLVAKSMEETWLTLSYWGHLIGLRWRLNNIT